MLFKRRCKKIESLLWGYAAARLSEVETAKVERHLNACPPCREQVKAYGQTVQGVATLRVQTVPTSQSNWQDVRRRLDAAPPIPSRRFPILAFRVMAAGMTLAGMTCLLVGVNILRQQDEMETQETALKPLSAKQSHTDRFKVHRQFPQRLIATMPDANLFANKFGNKGKQGEDMGTQPRFLAAEGMPALIKHRRAFKRIEQGGRYLTAVGRRRRNHLRSAYLLARHKEQVNAPSVQIVSLSLDASASTYTHSPEREQTEYVLTTIMDSAPQPRDFVMDSMTTGAQNNDAYSYNMASNGNGKEIRGW